MVWITQPKKTMGTLERPRAKRVARVVEVRWSGWPWAELGPVASAWGKGLAEEA